MTTKTTMLGRTKVLAAVMICAAVLAAGPVAGDVPEGPSGPDVVVFELPSTYNWGTDGTVRAYSVGTTSCNRGDTPLAWISNTNQHPVIAQNLYRVTLADPPAEHGKIEMLGMSWLKNGFVSINLTNRRVRDLPGQSPGFATRRRMHRPILCQPQRQP